MNANYIYEVFETTRENKAPDLTIGLAMLAAEKPLPIGMTQEDTRRFMGKHYDILVKAFKTGDKEVFVKVVAACEAEDYEDLGCADGVCDIPEV